MSLRYGKRPSQTYPSGRIDVDGLAKRQDELAEAFDDELNTFIDNSGRLNSEGILNDNSELHNGD
jgi:hypothetical protein